MDLTIDTQEAVVQDHHIQLRTVDDKGLEVCANPPLLPTGDFALKVSPMAGQLLTHERVLEIEGETVGVPLQPRVSDISSEDGSSVSSPMGAQLLRRKLEQHKFQSSKTSKDAEFEPRATISSPMGAQLIQRKFQRQHQQPSEANVWEEKAQVGNTPSDTQPSDDAQSSASPLSLSIPLQAESAAAVSSPMGVQLLRRKCEKGHPVAAINTEKLQSEKSATISSPMGCQLMNRKYQRQTHIPKSLDTSVTESNSSISSPMGCQLLNRKHQRQNQTTSSSSPVS